MKRIDHTSEWFYEGKISQRIVDHLKKAEYSIEKDNSSDPSQKGIDIIATAKSGVREFIEVKGYPSEYYARGSNKGLLKKTKPKLQAGHWFAGAIFSAISNHGKELASNKNLFCLGLPNLPKYSELIKNIGKYFTTYQIPLKIYLVDEFGKVTFQHTLVFEGQDMDLGVKDQKEVDFMSNLLRKSIRDLIQNDIDIFSEDEAHSLWINQLSHVGHKFADDIFDELKEIDRKLHEVAINHRLAYYIEKNIQNTALKEYHVDIEYNRYYYGAKTVQIANREITARPDIIVHHRMRNIRPQHYLVVEAKKGKIIENDRIKVEGFLKSPKYEYVFGLLVSYCLDAENVVGELLYLNSKSEIASQIISVPKSNHRHS